MSTQTSIAVLAALVVGSIGGYMFGTTQSTNEKIPAGMHRMHDGSMMPNEAPHANQMDHSMMMVTSEIEFISEMIPHHQEAVDTAKQVLARGATTPEITQLMQNIIAAQEKEIADMKAWYQAWYGTPYQPSGNYQPMMRDLSRLSGRALDQTFLEDMVMHHMGAIMMAQSVQPFIEHEEIRTLTQAIIISQSQEIELMRQLRAGL
jgi:uncharacterized protein (DUF305 family)